MVTTDKVTVTEFAPYIGKTTTDYIVDIWNYKENDMGVYIPNMKKPKFCKCEEYNCFAWDDEKYKCKITEWKKPCPLIEIDQEDEEAVLFLARMRKAMREGKSLREFLDGERRSE